MLATIAEGSIEQHATHPGNEDVFAAFIAALDASEKTKQTYTRSLRQWGAFLSESGEDAVTASRRTVLDFKESMLSGGKKASTVNAYLTAVRRLYAWLEAEAVKPNIAASIKGVRRSKTSPKESLTVDQAKEILASRPGEGAGIAALRDYALLNLLCRRGLRTIEAARANIGDIKQLNGQAVLCVQGKGYADKEEFVVLSEECLAPIYSYLAARGCKDRTAPLFASEGNRNHGGRMSTRSISRIIKGVFKAHGIEAASLTAHSTRHTAVTFALMAGASLQEAQAMARHRSINTTLIYAHNLDRMKAGAEHGIDRLLSAA